MNSDRQGHAAHAKATKREQMQSQSKGSDMDEDIKGQSTELFLKQRKDVVDSAFRMMIISVIIIPLVFLLPKVSSMLSNIDNGIAIRNNALNRLPDIEAKIAEIDAKFSKLQSSEVGSRLAVIEKRLGTEELNLDDIRRLDSLSLNVKKMQEYMATDMGTVFDIKTMHSKTEKIDALEKDLIQAHSDIQNEQTQKTIIFVLIGILFTMYFGSWWFQSKTKTPVTKVEEK